MGSTYTIKNEQLGALDSALKCIQDYEELFHRRPEVLEVREQFHEEMQYDFERRMKGPGRSDRMPDRLVKINGIPIRIVSRFCIFDLECKPNRIITTGVM